MYLIFCEKSLLYLRKLWKWSLSFLRNNINKILIKESSKKLFLVLAAHFSKLMNSFVFFYDFNVSKAFLNYFHSKKWHLLKVWKKVIFSCLPNTALAWQLEAAQIYHVTCQPPDFVTMLPKKLISQSGLDWTGIKHLKWKLEDQPRSVYLCIPICRYCVGCRRRATWEISRLTTLSTEWTQYWALLSMKYAT